MSKSRSPIKSSHFKALRRPFEYVVPKGYSVEDRVFLLRGVGDDIRFSQLRWNRSNEVMAAMFEGVQKRKVPVEKIARHWRTPRCTGVVSPWNDFPMASGYPAFSERAVHALGEMLTDHGVLLPVKCGRQTYFCFVPRVVRNVLNQSASVTSVTIRVKRWKQPIFRRYEFNRDRLAACPIFTTSEELYETFVTHAFVSRAVESGLVGLNCEIVYPLRRSEKHQSLALANLRRHLREGLPKGQTVSGAEVVVSFMLDHHNVIPTKHQEVLVRKWSAKVSGPLWDPRSMDVPMGYLFGVLPDTGRCLAIFKGPDRERLRKWLASVVHRCRWKGEVRIGYATVFGEE